jgi:hypothetical protein
VAEVHVLTLGFMNVEVDVGPVGVPGHGDNKVWRVRRRGWREGEEGEGKETYQTSSQAQSSPQ